MDHFIDLLTRREVVASIAGGIAFVVGWIADSLVSNGTHVGAAFLGGLSVAAVVWLAWRTPREPAGRP
jgi:hypothetical protein